METNKESSLTLQEKESIRKYMLDLVVLPGALLTVVSFFLGFFINEVAKQGAYNEAYSQATGVIMATAAEAAKTSGKIDGLYKQASVLLVEAEETRKKVELSAADIASKVSKDLSNNQSFMKKLSLPLTQIGNNLEQKIKVEENKRLVLVKKQKVNESKIINLEERVKTTESIVKYIRKTYHPE